MRRTQDERSAETRGNLIEAAIRLLCDFGYAGTTTTLLPAEAGVSRGAFQHHFRTRADLMVEVVRTVYAQEVEEYSKAFAAQGGFRLETFPEVVWDIVSRPAGIAVLEILNGSRSDRELAEQLLPIQQAIEENSVKNFSAALQLEDSNSKNTLSDDLVDVVRLIVWSARGLSIMQGMGTPQAELRRSIQLLCRLFADGRKGDVTRPA